MSGIQSALSLIVVAVRAVPVLVLAVVVDLFDAVAVVDIIIRIPFSDQRSALLLSIRSGPQLSSLVSQQSSQSPWCLPATVLFSVMVSTTPDVGIVGNA